MTQPQGHLDLDALAEVLAGERDDAHLRSCAVCTDELAALAVADAEVTAALTALPPLPLPDGLSLRLTRALQEERRREVATLRPLRRRAPSWLPAVAASAVLVMAGAAGWSLLDLAGSGGQDTSTETASGGGGAEDQDAQESESRDEAATALADPSAPAPAATSSTGSAPFAAPPAPTGATATDWAVAAARPAALSRLLVLPDTRDRSATAATADGLGRLRDPAALADCLSGLPEGDDGVLAVDYARFAGAPALAVVQAGEPGQVRVTVLGSGCTAGDLQLLDAAVLPRP